MPKFSQKSLNRLYTCDARLIAIFEEVIKHYDCSILEGFRDEETQNEYFRIGRSKLMFPNGKHNSIPSMAVDVAPYPVKWTDDKFNMYRYYHFVGYVLATADQMGIKLRCGADWDGDKQFNDQTLHDCPHFELVD